MSLNERLISDGREVNSQGTVDLVCEASPLVDGNGTVIFTESPAGHPEGEDTNFSLDLAAGTMSSIRQITMHFLLQAGVVRNEDLAQAQAAVSVLTDETPPNDILLAAISAAFPRTPAAHPHVSMLFRRHLKRAREAEPSANGSLRLQPMQFNGYRPIMRLGGGGFGEVFVVDNANAPENESPVEVLKRLYRPVRLQVGSWHPIDDSQKADADIERFKREARALKGLKGIPGVPQFRSRGTYVEPATGVLYPYFTMSYHPGQTLDKMLDAKNGKASKQQWVDIITLIAITLTQTHEREWVHRDLKPSNVLLTDKGKTKLFDFGLGRLHGDHEHDVTHTGQIMGTPDYMPPEQCNGQAHHVGPSADLYSLGCMLHEALQGEPPFGRAKTEKLVTIIQRHSGQAPDLSWVATLPAEFQKLGPALTRILQKKPTDRGLTNQLAQELYAASSFAREHKLSFDEFFARPELHHIHVPAAAVQTDALAIPSRFYEEVKEAGEDGAVRKVDLGPDHFTQALRSSKYPAEVQAATRGRLKGLFGYVAAATALTVVLAAGAIAYFSSGKSKDANADPVVVDVRPGIELKPPPELKKPPEQLVVPKLGSIVAEADADGRVKDIRLFAGMPCEVKLGDNEAVLFTHAGKTRAALTHISGDSLAKILGFPNKEAIPDEKIREGRLGIIFMDSEERWVLAINEVAYIVGRPQAKTGGTLGTVYSDRGDIKDSLRKKGFIASPNAGGYVQDPGLGAVIRGLPPLVCAEPNEIGINGETRGKNLSNVTFMADVLRKQLPAVESPHVSSNRK